MLHNKKSGKDAFTLIELVVSMGIIAMLSTLFIANYQKSNKRTDLVMTSQVMVTDIRYAQSNTLGLIGYDTGFPAGGWGLHVSNAEGENDRYTIFADINDSGSYDAGEAEERYGGRIVYLPPGIRVKQVHIFDYIGNPVSSDAKIYKNQLELTFLPPDPITRLKTEDAAIDPVTVLVDLENIETEEYKAVYINRMGLIDVK